MDGGRKRPTLKELSREKYPFPDLDLLEMLDDLLANGIIELPTPKRPEEAGRTADLKYCRYHWVISHPLEKCITLKERIMQLARNGRIILAKICTGFSMEVVMVSFVDALEGLELFLVSPLSIVNS